MTFTHNALHLTTVNPFVPSEEADDEDDPEYNVLDDLEEPDQEDYRTDRAVQITSRCWSGQRGALPSPGANGSLPFQRRR